MNETNDSHTETLPEREQEILDTALLESDQLLARSLHDDDRRRRRRRLWSLALIFGGVVMGTVFVAFLMGWFTLGQVQSSDDFKWTLEQQGKAEALAAEGWRMWKGGEYLGAAAQFEHVVELTPKDANAWNGYGWALFNSGQRTKATEAFEKCIKLSPKHPAGLNGLGQIYLAEGDLPKAEKYLKLAAPQAPAAWFGLARLYLLQEDFGQARTWAEKIVKQNPQEEIAQKMLIAAIAGSVDDELRAIIQPTKPSQKESAAKKEDSRTPEANDGAADIKRGWQMFFKQKYTTSERLFRLVLETEPENANALNGLGWSLLNQSKHDEAKPLLEKSLKLEKNHGGAMNGLAICLKAEGKVDEAIALWERGYAAAPGPNALAAGLATTYLEREEYEQAAKYYQILVDADKDNENFQEGLKKARTGLKNKVK